jgi:putative acetyltransferase
MIRKATPQDLGTVLAIWQDAVRHSHDFIEPGFWQGKLEDMRDRYLPSADIWVEERDGEVRGFFALQADVLAALFVGTDHQGEGVGSALLEQAKRLADKLELSVYRRNSHAVAFYQRHGFCPVDLRTDARAGHVELVMQQCDPPDAASRREADREAEALLQS